MKKTIIESLKLKESIPEEFIKEFHKGFFTGSYVFGGYDKDKSDIDIVLKYSKSLIKELKSYLIPSLEYKLSKYNENDFFSCYVRKENIVFNLLFFSDKKYYAWKSANELLTRLLDVDKELCELVLDKKFRVNLFELIRNKYGFEDTEEKTEK